MPPGGDGSRPRRTCWPARLPPHGLQRVGSQVGATTTEAEGVDPQQRRSHPEEQSAAYQGRSSRLPERSGLRWGRGLGALVAVIVEVPQKPENVRST